MLDWSSGNDTGPTPRKDAIWLGEAGREPVYLRNRDLAEFVLGAMFGAVVNAGDRLLIGVDVPFGYPAGFGKALTGSDDPFAVWDWLEANVTDTPKGNNRFQLADQINGGFPGIGPFWFNALKDDLPNLPRKDVRDGHGMAERRACDAAVPGTFTLWQMGGAGAVGGQAFTALAVLNRLRKNFPDQVAVWPFQTPETPIVLVETWPGLLNDAVKRAEAMGEIRDKAQVNIMAQAMAHLDAADLDEMLAVDATAEGWIFGAGHEDRLRKAASRIAPPPLRNDCFALPPGVDWTPVDTALNMLRDRLHPVTSPEPVSVFAAAGRVLAEDVIAKRSNPPQPNTAVDGYGFKGGAPDDAPRWLPLVDGRAAAGAPYDGTVPDGHAVRVLTGAALPDGVDTVVLEEDTTTDAGQIAFRGPLRQGANTRKAGEDIAAGAVALPKGRVLTPADLALASAVGHGELMVQRPLRVAVLSTGDELLEPGDEAGPGQIFDANRPMLLALAAGWGYAPIDIGRVPDDRDTLKTRLDEAAEKADVILTSGGASAGDEDHVSALLRESGAMEEWRIALKPGRPLALGLWNNTPVFGLPGNPVAALVCTLVFARPAFRLLSGEAWHQPKGVMVPAAFTKRKKPGRHEYLRARLRDGAAEVFKSEGSGRISGLSWAEGLVELGDGAAEITPGMPVKFIPYSAF
ncbi:molybdopterin-binding protein [Pseudoprimorskyibacter insulae]|nr:gephyrin-like molybdotransferase Glp [Pseudoprimorskyibacter insulae]